VSMFTILFAFIVGVLLSCAVVVHTVLTIN
jgi:predicted outer membrane lipoprotein